MELRIKVCGLRDNLAEVAALQPDYIGMIFYGKSPRFVGEDCELPELPDSVKKVGVFVNADINYVLGKTERYGLDLVQLHGDESPDYCNELREKGIGVVKAFPVDEAFDFSRLDAYFDHTDYFLFDTKTPAYGGSGKQFDWSLLEKYELDHPYFLSGGIGLEEIDSLPDVIGKDLHAIDVNSRVEIKPGLKDVGLLERLFESIEKINSKNQKTIS